MAGLDFEGRLGRADMRSVMAKSGTVELLLPPVACRGDDDVAGSEGTRLPGVRCGVVDSEPWSGDGRGSDVELNGRRGGGTAGAGCGLEKMAAAESAGEGEGLGGGWGWTRSDKGLGDEDVGRSFKSSSMRTRGAASVGLGVDSPTEAPTLVGGERGFTRSPHGRWERSGSVELMV